MLLGMDCMYLHKTKVDCLEKAIEYLDYNGEKRILWGKKNPKSVKMVTSMQAKRSCKNGCVMFVIHISSDKGKDVEDAEIFKRYHVLQQYQDMFLEKILESPLLYTFLGTTTPLLNVHKPRAPKSLKVLFQPLKEQGQLITSPLRSSP